MSAPTLAVVGGSGLYELDGLSQVEELTLDTPFGAPSDAIIKGRLGDTTLLFMPRHGRGHRVPPHAINFRANICALKMAGATHMLSVSAVGSMKEEIHPGHLVVVDQYIDLTKRRASTFFDEGFVAHVAFADPVCPLLSSALAAQARQGGATVHQGGTYVCIEGPQFSTRAESLMYRSWGVSVIGMTAMPEAKLAREAELPHATLALATDYDCWHESGETVSAGAVMEAMRNNVAAAKKTIAGLAQVLPSVGIGPAGKALEGSIMIARDRITPETRERLHWLVGKYV